MTNTTSVEQTNQVFPQTMPPDGGEAVSDKSRRRPIPPRAYAKAKGWWHSDASRAELSFVSLQANGIGVSSNWNVAHDVNACWHEGVERGRKRFHEVLELAKKNPPEAYHVIQHALAEMWSGGWGDESGFIQELSGHAVAAALAFPNGLPAHIDARRHSEDWYSDWLERKGGITSKGVAA